MIINKEAEDTGSNFAPKVVYLGKAAYNVVAVNPNKDELKAINQYVPDEEPVYTSKREIDGKEYPLTNVTIYLRNVADAEIVDRVTYTLVDNVQMSGSGKAKVINKYGDDSWLEPGVIASKVMPANMQWYLTDGIKEAIRGEKELVSFIRSLRNFKRIQNTSTQEDKDNYASLFERTDLDKLFKGDFKDIKALLMSNSESAVGFLLGARTADNGKIYQDIYKDYPLRKYMVNNDKSDEYIVKSIVEAQDNGRYANTYFNVDSLKFQPYTEEMEVKPDVADEMEDDLPF